MPAWPPSSSAAEDGTVGRPAVPAVSGRVPPAFTEPAIVARALRGDSPLRDDGVLAVPVRSRRGEVLGALYCETGDGNAFTERTERMVAGIAGQAAAALDNASLFKEAQAEIVARQAAEAQLAHAATHDPLTGLPNRTLFLDRLTVALGRSERVATPSASCCSTSTASRSSTTASGTRRATSCWWRWPSAWPSWCAPATPLPASVATSSSWCAKTSTAR